VRTRLPVALAVALAAALLPAATAWAQDPGRWALAQADRVPLEYYQGLTHSPGRSLFFVGVFQGAYATDDGLREAARNPQVLPPDVGALGFNHIGDPTYDAGEGGRLLLPLECYTPGAPNGGNTCGRGAIGVADPATLSWRYLVPLDPADIHKAMWAEVSPDGSLLWTSAGADLIAYATADISPPAASAGGFIHPVRRIAGAAPPSGITGGAFWHGRLYLAGQGTGLGRRLQIWSVDLSGRSPRRLEVELPVAAESEGLDVIDARGGLLHWLLSPFAPGAQAPTFGTGHSELLTFVPRTESQLRLTVTPAHPAGGRPVTLTARVTIAYAGRRRAVEGARVQAGSAVARTDPRGTVRLRVTPRAAGSVLVTATKQQLVTGRFTVRTAGRRGIAQG
jgi:hypothetical protein